ncbi:hypothetical protein H4R35_006403 [Dimargaris xerosporica]|nr:hypothetical protein H4R35_006403 [Dimargaris xerosporica]
MATTVQVALRVRPLTAKEQQEGEGSCVAYIPDQPQIVVNQEKSFTFDHVLDPATTQPQMYERCAAALVDQFLDGYNATVLAYGQTGSGKTYSMGTAAPVATGDASDGSQDYGIIPRAVNHLFAGLAQRQVEHPDFEFNVEVSFLELYNEDLIDLLNSTNRSDSSRRTRVIPSHVTIREDAQGGIVWGGVTHLPANNTQAVMQYLHQGSLFRTTAATDMNMTSSRSHAIFSIQLWQKRPNSPSSEESPDTTPALQPDALVSKFHFVDLAGSERIKRTNAIGDRVKEGISINAGLLALGNVISALGDESRKSSHIPYRDSKLTRLLQDSLGGNR